MFALQIEMSRGLFINVYLVTQQKKNLAKNLFIWGMVLVRESAGRMQISIKDRPGFLKGIALCPLCLTLSAGMLCLALSCRRSSTVCSALGQRDENQPRDRDF